MAQLCEAMRVHRGIKKMGIANRLLGAQKEALPQKSMQWWMDWAIRLNLFSRVAIANEIIKAEELIEDIHDTNVIADKAYDSDKFRKKIKAQGCKHTIPPRRNRKIQHEYDAHIYVERHLIECFFSKIKQFRRVFSRFDKIKHTFQAFIDFASTLINLR